MMENIQKNQKNCFLECGSHKCVGEGCSVKVCYIRPYLKILQGCHKPGILRGFSEHGKLMESSGNSVQPQGKLTLDSGCSLCQAIHMQPSVSGARKLLI